MVSPTGGLSDPPLLKQKSTLSTFWEEGESITAKLLKGVASCCLAIFDPNLDVTLGETNSEKWHHFSPVKP